MKLRKRVARENLKAHIKNNSTGMQTSRVKIDVRN